MKTWLHLFVTALTSVGMAQAEVIATVREGYSTAMRLQPQTNGRSFTLLAGGRIAVIKPGNGESVHACMRRLKGAKGFANLAENRREQPCSTPNDPEFGSQWHLGQISAPRAWDFVAGASSTVAIVDGGVDLNHPDLTPNLVPGYNTLTGLAQTAGGVVADVRSNGHGTRIAGVLAARGNNGIGVAGVGWNLRIMPVRATDDAAQGFALRSELLEGVQWALDHGAKVVSVSYTGVENADVQAMGEYARSLGSHLVWAAGNANSDWSGFDHYAVTIVGGTNSDDSRWISGTTVGSGYGRAVDIYAPCIQIKTTNKGGGYGYAPAGTSFAVPQVAAALALVAENQPSWTPWQVERRVLMACRDIGLPGADLTSGWGRLNVGKAIDYPSLKYAITFLPTPAGATNTSARTINDNGVTFGESSTPVYPLLVWQGNLLSAQIPASQLGLMGPPLPTESNNLNQVVGFGLSPSFSTRGFFFEIGAGNVNLPPATGYINSKFLGIAEAGHVAGSDYNDQSVHSGWIRFDGGSLLLEPDAGATRVYDVNDLGHYIGNSQWTSGNPGIYWGGSLATILGSITYPRNDLVRITNRGDVIGNESDFTLNYLSQPFFIYPPYSTQQRIVLAPAGGHDVADINDRGFVVGRKHSVSRAVFGEPGFGELRFLDESLTTPLPPNVRSLDAAEGVNNQGTIVGRASTFSSLQVPFLAEPQTSSNMLINLGQLGETPTYIGSIPPSLSVTYLNEVGQPYTDGTVLHAYNVLVGRLELVPPSSVIGPYRMYLRCSGSLIPGYPGPRYLNKLYPPMSEPAAGPDTVFLPYSGSSHNGGDPALEMYAGDVDSSGEIDAADIDVVISKFGTVDGGPGWVGEIDVDGTGEIDAADIDLVISNFGLVDDELP